MHKTDLYICGTFRDEWSRNFNLALCEKLERVGYTVFLPQRDSDQRGERSKTFKEDIAGISGAACVVAIGARLQSANWGFEIGYAFAQEKPVIAITDKEHGLELMTSQAVSQILVPDDINNIDSYLGELLDSILKYLPSH